MKNLKIYSIVCLSLILVLSIRLQAQETEDYYMAKVNAESAANRDVSKACWFGAGMTIIGSGVALMWHSSSPDPVAFAGKSPEYIRAYSDAYNSRVKKIQTFYSCLGCGTTLTMAGCALLMIELNQGCQDWSDENCFPESCVSSSDKSSCIDASDDGSSCGSGDNSSCGSSSGSGSSCGSGSGG
jgi:uncharacterized membrane protein YgcG